MNRKLKPITDDLFSQMPEPDESYEVNSFLLSDSYMTQKPPKKTGKKPKRTRKGKHDVDSDDLELIEEAAAAGIIPEINPIKKMISKNLSTSDESVDAKTSKFRRVKLLSDSSADEPMEASVYSKPDPSKVFGFKRNKLNITESSDNTSLQSNSSCVRFADKREAQVVKEVGAMNMQVRCVQILIGK